MYDYKDKNRSQLRKEVTITKRLLNGILIIFIAVSVKYIKSPNQEQVFVRDSQLSEIVTITDNTIKTDYVNEKGVLTNAANLGYATKLTTKMENGELDEFFDNEGNRTSIYPGYSGLLYTFDEKENRTSITYLDKTSNPTMVLLGYATEERTLNDKNQIIEIRYYDTEGNPVLTPLYGYGQKKEYDADNHACKTTYTDIAGNAMMTKQGYAIIYQTFYQSEGIENGRVEYEFYYDDKSQPVSLSLGQYGTHKAYNQDGLEAETIYLDMDGNPIITNKGYTKIVRTYRGNDIVVTVQYYDINGEPFQLSKGQYGTTNRDGQVAYLDRDGNRMITIQNFLHDQPWVIIVSTIAIVVISSFTSKTMHYVFLAISVAIIIYLTLLFRGNAGVGINLHPFWSYRQIISDGEIRAEIIKNIWLFIPLGVILYKIKPQKGVLLIPFAFSLIIEMIQYAAGIGFCELDDVISNSLGGVIGYLAGISTANIKQCIKSRKKAQSI